jgi:hypothetical protein
MVKGEGRLPEFIVIFPVVKAVFPGPQLPEFQPNQQSPSNTTSKVNLLVPADNNVP